VDGPIVVGTDGSETATNAVMEAVRLSAALDRPLHIVSAYKPLHPPGGVPSEFQGSIAPSSVVQSVLEDASARARVAGVKAETHPRVGDAADVLLDLAEELDAGLLVVGNKGIGSMRRYVLGNVPSKVVHHSPCSTYVVHTT
jgi:nucleotide-binding universal stress UspA family protein